MSVVYIDYFATHGRGTFEFFKNELLNLNLNEEKVRIKDYVEGKIHFESLLEPNKIKPKLKIIERLFLCILFKKFNESNQNMTLDDLIDSISFENFGYYYGLFMNETETNNAKQACLTIKYRINCKLTGKWRQKNSNNKLIMKKIEKKFQNEYLNSKYYEIDTLNPNFEIILHISENCIALGLQLGKEPLSHRSYIKHVGLRSTTCAIMLQLAGLDENSFNCGKIIYDPFCGKGTIFVEHLGSLKSDKIDNFYLMSDMSNEQLNLCVENFEFLNRVLCNVNLLKYNFKENIQFPFADNTIDVIISDLPFGKKHPFESFKSNKQDNFYFSVINEFKRLIIKNDGIVVLLINKNDMSLFEEAIEASNKIENLIEFKVSRKHILSLGETIATAYKIVTVI